MEKLEQSRPANEEITLHALSYHASQTHESSEEFHLPDYMPAVRRVISVQATPLPESRFLTGKALEFGGTLAYSVLYMGEGGELYCAPLTSEYAASVSLGEDGASDAAAVGLDTAVENVTCRVTAPRRLTLKCRLRTTVTSIQPRRVADALQDISGARITAADEITVERLAVSADDAFFARGEMTASVSGNFSETGKVIACRASVHVEEATSDDGAVNARGEVILHTLLRTDGGKYVSTSLKTPFSESVPVSGAEAGDSARAWGRAASVSVSGAEEGGTWEIEYDLEAQSARACTRSYTADMFSTVYPCSVEMAETDSLHLLRCGQGTITVSGEGGRQSKAAEGECVLDAYASCTADRVEVRDGKLVISGNCAFTALILQDGDIVCEEFSLPLRYECDAGQVRGDGEIVWRCSADAVTVAVRAEGEKLNARAEVSLALCAMERSRIRYTAAATLTKSAARAADDGCIRICYPDKGEALWDIAKTYGVSRQTIRAQNGLSEAETVCDGAPLLI